MDAHGLQSGFAQPSQPTPALASHSRSAGVPGSSAAASRPSPKAAEPSGCRCCRRRSKRETAAMGERIELLQAEISELTRKEQAAQAHLRIVRDQITAVQLVTNEAKSRVQATHQQIRKAEAERRATIEWEHRSQKLQECRQRLLASQEKRESLKTRVEDLKQRQSAADQEADVTRKANIRLAELEQELQQLVARHAEAQSCNKRSEAQVEQFRQLQQALLERGSRDSQRLGELQSQNDKLAQELRNVYEDVASAKTQQWSQVPYREDAATEIERLRRKAIADEGQLENLRQELNDVTMSIEAARAARQMAEPCAMRPRNLADEVDCSTKVVQAAKTISGIAKERARQVAKDVDTAKTRLASQASVEPGALPRSSSPSKGPDTPPIPMSLVKDMAADLPSHQVTQEPLAETVLEVTDLAPPVLQHGGSFLQTSQYCSAAPGREPVSVLEQAAAGSPSDSLAEVEATNQALRHEIAALRERMQQHTLREEIAALRDRMQFDVQSLV